MRNVFAIISLVLSAQLVAQQATESNSSSTTKQSNRIESSQTEVDSQKAVRKGAAAGDLQVVRASEIIGTSVKNKAEEELGSINDLVIDPVDGQIAYAAVSMGGFLGVGDKLFAVPWDAIECRKVEDDHVAVLDVDKKALENARGFDEANWPDMANERWRAENDRPYTGRRRIREPEAGQHDVARQPVQEQQQ
jgi:sporulation protein YlmC with PRC-barrel domain